MSIIIGCILGFITLIVMMVTIEYYVPKLKYSRNMMNSKAYSQSDEEKEGLNTEIIDELKDASLKCSNFILSDKRKRGFLIGICVLYSFLCGFVINESAISYFSALKLLLVMAVLSCVFITDLELMIIPNLCSIILILCRILIALFEILFNETEIILWLINSFVALVICFLFLLMMMKITGGGIGFGDVKIFSSIGFVCGIQAVCFTLMLSFISCAFFSTILLLLKKRSLKDTLPMGPFIWFGFGLSILLRII